MHAVTVSEESSVYLLRLLCHRYRIALESSTFFNCWFEFYICSWLFYWKSLQRGSHLMTSFCNALSVSPIKAKPIDVVSVSELKHWKWNDTFLILVLPSLTTFSYNSLLRIVKNLTIDVGYKSNNHLKIPAMWRTINFSMIGCERYLPRRTGSEDSYIQSSRNW